MKRSERTPSSRVRGFTLTELLMVVVIVGILASVSIPVYREVISRAYATEAEAGLGTIRSALRALLVQSITGDWSGLVARYTPGLLLKPTDISELNLRTSDLGGRYFNANAYRMTGLTATTFIVQALGDSSTAGEADVVRGMVRQIDQAGSVTEP